MSPFRLGLLSAAATVAFLGTGPAMGQGVGVQALVEQAGFWRGQGQPARAAAALERALLTQPSHPEALAAAAVLRMEMGEAATAGILLERLRQAAPGDARIARVEAALRGGTPAAPAELNAGEAALRNGDLAAAATTFEAALARQPGDRDAMGGLGLVRLRQGRAAEARDLLSRAGDAARFAGPLAEAAFATELTEARRRLAAGAVEEAEAVLLRALRRETAERAEAEALLGTIALRAGDWREAEARFRAAAARRPAHPAARDGLLESLRRQGRIAEAEGLTRGLPATLRADALRAEAARTEDPASALALLRVAVAEAAPNPAAQAGARLDLARLLARQGLAAEARAAVEEPLSGAAPPEAFQAAALFAEGEGRLADAMRILERVPDRVRGADHAPLLRALRWQAEIAEARTQGQPGFRGAMLALAGRADPSGEAAPLALRALLRAEDTEGAREALRRLRAPGPAARIALAAALADAGLATEASEVLRPLGQEASLSPSQRRQVAALGGPSAPRPAVAEAPSETPAPIQAEPPRLYQGARDPRVAGRIAEAVLRRDPRNLEARAGAVEAALVQRDLAAAETLLAEGRLMQGDDPRIAVIESRLARATGDRRRAQTALQLAADQRRAQLAAAPAAGGATPYRRTMLAGDASTGDGQGSSFIPLDSNPASAAVGGVTPSQLRASDDPLLSEIGRQLAEVNEQAAGRVVPNFAFRVRSGERGLERLQEFGGGAEAAVPLPGIGGELSARVQAVNIDSGRFDPTLANLTRFGTNAIVLPGSTGSVTSEQQAALAPRDRSATGTSLGVAYARDGVTVDLGSSPLGFREQTILGGVDVTPRLSENLQLRLRGERRSVTDSLLSWSGMRDPRTGTTFGGVTRNTGRAQLEYFDNRFGAYAGAGYSSITGRNVADNNRIEAGAGVSYAIIRNQDRELVTGLDLAYYGYDRNLRLFTLGHGGYFSPQTYLAATIPVDYRERRGNWAYRLGASIGVSHFREKSSPYYPGNDGLQAELETRALSDTSIATSYPSQKQTNVTAGLRGDLEYAITPTLRVGASARYDRSADFNEVRGLIYARYRFDP